MAATAHPEEQARQRVTHVVLVVDDDAIVRDLLRSLLTRAGYIVVSAASGHEALSYAPFLDASLAIMDLAMPDGNGVEATVALRRLPNWQTVPIVILTSYHTDKALMAARSAGASGFVCKPFVPTQLLRRIANLTGGSFTDNVAAPMVWGRTPAAGTRLGAGQPDTKPPAPPIAWRQMPGDAAMGGPSAAAAPEGLALQSPNNIHLDEQRAVLRVYRSVHPRQEGAPTATSADDEPPQHRRILVADDDELTRHVATHILGSAGYLAHSASNGQEALAAVLRDQYDMVLMDIRMPVLDGTNATRLIRSLPGGKRLMPIVAMTTTNFQTFTRELIAAGMNGYLMKPIRGDSLLSCVREHLPPLPSDRPARTLELDRLEDAVNGSPPGTTARLLDNLADLINAILPGVQGWVAVEQADLKQRLHELAEAAGAVGCAALSDVAQAIEAEPTLSDALQQRFLTTARATLAAMQPYRT